MDRAGFIPSLAKEGWREAPGWFEAAIPQLRSDSYTHSQWVFVIPANAGIQAAAEKLDTRFRGYDELGRFWPLKRKNLPEIGIKSR
jgi:hypothetical protein